MFVRRASLPDLSKSMLVARLRHIQSIHEPLELRNPDTLVKYFIPTRDRLRDRWVGRERLVKLRAEPFYYYLVARTRYYDQLVLDAISCDVHQIINVGSGSDTRAHRFVQVLKGRRVRVLECDQPRTIYCKRRISGQFNPCDHIEYFALDLNEDLTEFQRRLAEIRAKSLVLMEGVSPYVEERVFDRFLLLLAENLPVESRIAYDFKLRGILDGYGRDGRTQKPFRLSNVNEEVATFHAKHGLRLEHMELSSQLSARVLPILAERGVTLFEEDSLVQLIIDRT